MLAYSPRSKDIIMYSSHIMTVAYKYSSEKDLIGLLMCEAFSGGKYKYSSSSFRIITRENGYLWISFLNAL